MARIKLGLHLVPESSFFSNLRNTLGPRKWSRLSREIRSKYNFTCQYCGAQEDPGRRWYTHLHEVWQYDEKTGIQKLKGFECICPDCHHVHHWMFSEYKGFDLNHLVAHACKVNHCSRADFERHIAEERVTWKRRSKIKWTLDYGAWKHLV